MKKKLILTVATLVFITGCFSSKSTLEKTLEEKGYECSKKICTLSSKEDIYQTVTIYDLENKTYKKSSYYNETAKENKEITYNWEKGIVTFKSNMAGMEFNSTYNKETEEYTCTSNVESDTTFKKVECDIYKDDILEVIKEIDKVVSTK